MKPVVIARFSIVMLAVSALAVWALIAFFCRSFLSPELAAAPALLLFGLTVYRRNAIWISGDHLHYREYPLDFTRAVPVSSISDVVLAKRHDWFFDYLFNAYVLVIKAEDKAYEVAMFAVFPGAPGALVKIREAVGLPVVGVHTGIRPRMMVVAALLAVVPLLLCVMPLISALTGGEFREAALILGIASLGISGVIFAFRDESLLLLCLFWIALLLVAGWIYVLAGSKIDEGDKVLFAAGCAYLIAGLGLTLGARSFSSPPGPG